MKSRNGEMFFQLAPLLVAALAALVACRLSLAPSPVPATAPPEMFSAERAHHHIAVTCIAPQPAGSINNDRAAEYIKSELDRLGVENELVLRYDRTHDRQVSRRRAVLGRIRGTAPTKAFAVDAHFDSVPWGPGAADDFSGVAAMLEAARALKAGPPLKNDVIFVFSDQEEFNMGGARLFRDHPWFLEVGVMLGLETRGNSGPSLMFETSPQNGFVVRELARSGAGARTNSIMYDFYKRMPFNSDFNHYKDRAAGLNAAFINDFYKYHTMLDNPSNVSLSSLQHHGNYIVGLARHLGNRPLHNCYAPDVAYFNTLGNHMVVYPLSWGWLLTAGALLLLAAVYSYGFFTQRLSWQGVLWGVAAVLAAVLMAALPIGLISYALFIRFKEAALYQNNVYALGFHFLGFSAFCISMAIFKRWAKAQELLAGGLAFWAVGLMVFQHLIPGGAPLVLWPLVISCLYLAVLISMTKTEQPSERSLRWMVLFALPPIMFISPLLYMACYAATVLASFLIVPLALVLCIFLLPQLCVLSQRFLCGMAAISLTAACALLGMAYLGTLPSPDSPKLNCLAYGVNFDADQAYWMSSGSEMDEWTSLYIPKNTAQQRISEFIPRDHHLYFKAPALLPPFEAPRLEVREERIENGRRVMDCFLDSPRDAQRLWLSVTSDIQVLGATVLDHQLEGGKKEWSASFEILPREGVSLRLEVEPDKPLVFNVREMSYGLPAFPDFTPRPDYMMPEPNRRLDRSRSMESEFTYSTCTIDLGSGPKG